jgi:hypothetical protein
MNAKRTAAAAAAAVKKPRSPADRDQGRKTDDPNGEVMRKRNVRYLDRQWQAQQRRGLHATRTFLDLTDEEYDNDYLPMLKRVLRRRDRMQA